MSVVSTSQYRSRLAHFSTTLSAYLSTNGTAFAAEASVTGTLASSFVNAFIGLDRNTNVGFNGAITMLRMWTGASASLSEVQPLVRSMPL